MAQVARKAREGMVVSDKMDKTVVVAVSSSTRHRLYKKLMRRLRRYMVHDETNDAKLGDRVRIVESRPHSRHKRWKLAEVLVRADRPELAAEEIDLELLGEVKAEAEEKPEAKEVPEAEAAAELEVEEAPEIVEEAKAEAEEPPEAAEKAEELPEAEEQPPEAAGEAEEEPEGGEAPEAEEPEVEGEEKDES